MRGWCYWPIVSSIVLMIVLLLMAFVVIVLHCVKEVPRRDLALHLHHPSPPDAVVDDAFGGEKSCDEWNGPASLLFPSMCGAFIWARIPPKFPGITR